MKLDHQEGILPPMVGNKRYKANSMPTTHRAVLNLRFLGKSISLAYTLVYHLKQ